MSNLYIGVQTEDLPTLTTAGITGATINNAGFLGKFDRGIDKVVEVRNFSQMSALFGRFKSTMNGMYVVNGYFQNLQGVEGKAFVKRIVPSDAVAASVTYDNEGANETIKFEAGRVGNPDKGVWGNQLRILVTASSRGNSLLSAATSSGSPNVVVDSVAPFAVGDWVTVAGSSTFNGKVLSIDEQTNTLTLSVNAGGVNAIGQVVSIVDRTIKIYAKDSETGNIELVETIFNTTISPESSYYIEKIINDEYGSAFIKVGKLTTDEDGTFEDFPVALSDAVTNAVALTGGAEGTSLTTTQMAAKLQDFNSYNIFYLTNTEDFSENVVDDGEAYCNVRKDCVWVGCPTSGLTFAAALNWANKRRKSRKIYNYNTLNWLLVDDPIGTGPLPTKKLPNVGHVIGYSIYVTATRGIHKVPASRLQTLVGIRGLVGELTKRDELRDLANAGLNCISDLVGSYAIRSARTPSKLKEWTFSNALLMSIYFKKSFEDSLQDVENEPNTAALLGRIRESIATFAFAFYRGSSNGGGEGGFASFEKSGGVTSDFSDVTKIVADESINPIAKINAGELRVNFYFMSPAPAERVMVGVGLLYLQ